MKRTRLIATVSAFVVAAAAGAGSAAKLPQAGAIAPASARLAIVHVQKGCHLWSNGRIQAATMSLRLRPGGALTVVNNDVDVHQLVQLSGFRVSLPGPLMMTVARTIRFQRAGVYVFKTKVVEMEGMNDMMQVETVGPDHVLRLVVTVV